MLAVRFRYWRAGQIMVNYNNSTTSVSSCNIRLVKHSTLGSLDYLGRLIVDVDILILIRSSYIYIYVYVDIFFLKSLII